MWRPSVRRYTASARSLAPYPRHGRLTTCWAAPHPPRPSMLVPLGVLLIPSWHLAPACPQYSPVRRRCLFRHRRPGTEARQPGNAESRQPGNVAIPARSASSHALARFGWKHFNGPRGATDPHAETAVMGSRPKRPVTFWCEWCGDEVTEERPPGPRPRYCPGCYPKAQRTLSAERVWRYRTRQAELRGRDPEQP